MWMPHLSRRSLMLGAAVSLPAVGLSRADDLVGPLNPRERQEFVFQRRQDVANAELK
jgi:hypothetical protein